jgi:hypothetical protein
LSQRVRNQLQSSTRKLKSAASEIETVMHDLTEAPTPPCRFRRANPSWLRTDLSVSTTDSDDSEFEYSPYEGGGSGSCGLYTY